MTNNFEKVKQYIKTTFQYSGGEVFGQSLNDNDDIFFSIEIIRRGKDHPNMPAANYLFKNYHINKLEDLDKFQEEIISMCDILKMRAYFSINRKSYRKCLLKQNELIAKRIYDGDFKKPHNTWQSAISQYAHSQDKRWIVDVDTVDIDLNHLKQIINTTQAGDNRIISELKTKNGYHIITLPFDVKKFNSEIEKQFGVDNNIEIKKNALTLLYENI